jgi:hypothetical protein
MGTKNVLAISWNRVSTPTLLLANLVRPQKLEILV